ncbi:hypothetical protein, partial [Gluconacetobacter tumulicola]|uniref:hypothetical protein n=1 Tax=Gluconacetobacter tumulicola TaxID=1017177 RepID=UPI0031E804BE
CFLRRRDSPDLWRTGTRRFFTFDSTLKTAKVQLRDHIRSLLHLIAASWLHISDMAAYAVMMVLRDQI